MAPSGRDMDWLSKETEILLNPKMPQSQKELAFCKLPKGGEFSSHVWLATSGSTNQQQNATKFVALSKRALLSSAAAVNCHLFSTSEDIWLNALPSFHVGGLGVLARAFLMGCKVISFEGKWNALAYYDFIVNSKATLASLVPTQLYDLVSSSLVAPKGLRAMVVGGGRLSAELQEKARNLSWPILPSYGMTEASSQVATASLETPYGSALNLKILDHIEVAIDEKGFIALRGPSLLTCYGYLSEDSFAIDYPKSSKGWFVSQDYGEKQGDILTLLGRSHDFVKIGGESVDVGRLNAQLLDLKGSMAFDFDAAIVPLPHERLGHELHLAVAVASEKDVNCLLEAFHKLVMPFERIRCVHYMKELPRSPLGKLLPIFLSPSRL